MSFAQALQVINSLVSNKIDSILSVFHIFEFENRFENFKLPFEKGG